MSQRTITLNQVLSPTQLKEVERICKAHTDIERTKKLKEFYGTLREMLDAQGIDPNWLAYATEYIISQKR